MFLKPKLIQLLCRWESKEEEDNPIILVNETIQDPQLDWGENATIVEC